MGKTTGFLEYTRTGAPQRPVEVRIQDYAEVTLLQTPEALAEQSARCMDCGVPFCHASFVVEGAAIGCPLANLVPEINDLVYRGDIPAAFARLSKTHPFPEITGRVCPALCEGSCTLGQHGDPVTVRDIERYVADTMLQSGAVRPRIPAARLGRRVAVVGSGPSGLACADLLNQLGNHVTVYERAEKAGGLLMYGIPGMKLDKGVVQNRVRLLADEGVEFVTGCEIGADLPFLRLMQEYDAIVLCIGATQERLLQAPGANATGVVTAMQYLTASIQSTLEGTPIADEALDASGKQVVVVGGGDTGTDCVATAVRQGAAGVVQLEILPRLPDERDEASNPWPLWPRKSKTDYGHHEAAAVYGGDIRRYQTTVREVVADPAGRVQAVKTVEVEWREGRPVEVPGSEREIPAGLVVTAMGFTGPQAALPGQLGLETDARGNIQTAEGGYATSLARVFTAGDAHRGPSLVVWAISEGRKAALECHKALQR